MLVHDIEVSYHRTVNLGQYNSAMLGTKMVASVGAEEDKIAAYEKLQQAVRVSVDALADKVLAEATVKKP